MNIGLAILLLFVAIALGIFAFTYTKPRRKPFVHKDTRPIPRITTGRGDLRRDLESFPIIKRPVVAVPSKSYPRPKTSGKRGILIQNPPAVLKKHPPQATQGAQQRPLPHRGTSAHRGVTYTPGSAPSNRNDDGTSFTDLLMLGAIINASSDDTPSSPSPSYDSGSSSDSSSISGVVSD